jgi:hypothetical protein
LQLTDTPPNRLRTIIAGAAAAAAELSYGPFDRQRKLLSALLHRITLYADSIRIEIKRAGLASLLTEPHTDNARCPEGLFELILPIQLKRRGVEAKLVMKAAGNRSPIPDTKLVTLFADALPILAFLAPDIVEAILDGRQPIGLTPRQLKRIGALPCRWDDQRRRLGFNP